MKLKYLIIGIASVLFLAFLAWLFATSSSKPKPGERFTDQGADHLTDISGIAYNSNPPTSGSHFPVWAKRGVYDRVLSDGHLIHSLEHGYIVISYNCQVKEQAYFNLAPTAYAHEGHIHEATDSSEASASGFLTKMKVGLTGDMSAFTPENAPEAEVELSEEFKTAECKQLVDQLATMLDNYQRVVIVPRINLDSRIALTAWTRLEKLNNFDEAKIKTFIEAYHNQGPEKTVE